MGLNFALARRHAAMLMSTIVCASMSAQAATLIAPSSIGGAEGSTSTTSAFYASSNVFQWYYRPADLAGLSVGSVINGIAFRADKSVFSAAPASNLQFSSWNLELSNLAAGTSDTALSTTVANNVGTSAAMVTSGPLTIALKSFTATSSPRPFGAEIAFSTPYTYTGGDLLFTLQYTNAGSTGGPALDAVAAPSGGTTAFYQYSSYQGGAASAIPVVQLYQADAPEPVTVGLLAVAAALASVGRRRHS